MIRVRVGSVFRVRVWLYLKYIVEGKHPSAATYYCLISSKGSFNIYMHLPMDSRVQTMARSGYDIDLLNKTFQHRWGSICTSAGHIQPVLHNWCNKGHSMYYHVCWMTHIKRSLSANGNNRMCGRSLINLF